MKNTFGSMEVCMSSRCISLVDSRQDSSGLDRK